MIMEKKPAGVKMGIEKNVSAVSSTMGPYGRTVTIDVGGGMMTVKDGVTVSRYCLYDDVWEKVGSHIVRSACMRTVEEAGDGTSLTAVLVGALSGLSWEYGLDEELRRLVMGVEAYVDELSVGVLEGDEVSREKIERVAYVSANGREDISGMIGDMIGKLGRYGRIMVEEGEKLEGEVLRGYSWRGGVMAAQFYNKPGRLSIEGKIVVVNEEVGDLKRLTGLLERWGGKEALILVVGGCSGQALSTFVRAIEDYRVGRGDREIYVVSAPSFGEERHEMLKDLVSLCGGVVWNHMRGYEVKDFGYAYNGGKREPCDHWGRGRVEVRGGRVYVFHDGREEFVRQRVEELKAAGVFGERLSMLTGGLGVIRVGGGSELEVTNNREIVDDALRACYAAIAGGVVPGGGRCLEGYRGYGYERFGWVLRRPKEVIWENAGLVAPEEGEGWSGAFVKGGSGDMLAEGIVDPAIVIKSAVRNAVSAAIQYLSTEYYISVKG